MDKFWQEMRENSVVQAIAVIVVIVGIVALLIAGVGFFGSIFLVLLVGVSMFFGSMRVLAGSALLAVILKTNGAVIHAFVSIWATDPRVAQFFTLIDQTGYIRLIITLFFFFYLVAFGSRSVNIFRSETNVTCEHKEKAKG